MRKFLALAATVILGGALLIAGCGNDNNKQAANNGKQVLKIGATAVPHAEILEQVKPILAKDGIDLQITEFTDYNTPNLSLIHISSLLHEKCIYIYQYFSNFMSYNIHKI